ncbi:MAG: Bug family tripartite tricarboxylate transporter substrate binding protein [Pseudomonadota bacterium]|jgi:tripartite-type tricarboxylate transporter receptor subunit TctC
MQRQSIAARRVTAALFLFAAAPTLAIAASFPTRPVRVVVPFAPGGASDFVGRILQPRLAAELGQSVVVDNRSGAAGNIGVEVAASASPDGHTLLLGNVGTMAINPSLYPKFRYQPLRDLVPITQVVDVPGSLVVHPSVPAQTVKELVDLLRSRPGQFNFASSGAGSANRLEMELFMRATGTQLTHVPFKGGAGPAVASLLGGETHVAFLTLSSTTTFVKQGRLRLLGVVSASRVAAVADTPTLPESGFADMRIGSWQGMFAPRGTPQPVLDRLFTVTRAAARHADSVERLSASGVLSVTSDSSQAFRVFVQSEIDRYGKVIRAAGITAD